MPPNWWEFAPVSFGEDEPAAITPVSSQSLAALFSWLQGLPALGGPELPEEAPMDLRAAPRGDVSEWTMRPWETLTEASTEMMRRTQPPSPFLAYGADIGELPPEFAQQLEYTPTGLTPEEQEMFAQGGLWPQLGREALETGGPLQAPVLEQLAAAYRARPEVVPGQKGIEMVLADPANIAAELIPGIGVLGPLTRAAGRGVAAGVRRGARVAPRVGREALEAVAPTGRRLLAEEAAFAAITRRGKKYTKRGDDWWREGAKRPTRNKKVIAELEAMQEALQPPRAEAPAVGFERSPTYEAYQRALGIKETNTGLGIQDIGNQRLTAEADMKRGLNTWANREVKRYGLERPGADDIYDWAEGRLATRQRMPRGLTKKERELYGSLQMRRAYQDREQRLFRQIGDALSAEEIGLLEQRGIITAENAEMLRGLKQAEAAPAPRAEPMPGQAAMPGPVERGNVAKLGDTVTPTAADGTMYPDGRITDIQRDAQGNFWYQVEGSQTYLPEAQIHPAEAPVAPPTAEVPPPGVREPAVGPPGGRPPREPPPPEGPGLPEEPFGEEIVPPEIPEPGEIPIAGEPPPPRGVEPGPAVEWKTADAILQRITGRGGRGAGVVPPAPPGAVPPGAVPPESPVAKLTRLIRSAGPARETTEKLYTKERARRAAIGSQMLAKGEGREAFRAAKGQLRGELPRAAFEAPEVGLTANEITDLANMIRDSGQEFYAKITTETAFEKLLAGGIPQRRELELLEEVFGSELIEAILSKRPLSARMWSVFREVANLPRALLTAFDLSASLRQGALFLPTKPKEWAKAHPAMVKALLSENNAKIIQETIEANPYYALARQNRLYIAPLRGRAARVTSREERFMSRFIGKIPGVRVSERAYITFLNKLRMDVFAGYGRLHEAGAITSKELRSVAKVINYASGRGTLGPAEGIGDILATGIFSPRFQLARLQLPWAVLTGVGEGRKLAARLIVSFVGMNAGLLALLNATGVASVELDPTSSDFGKARIGNTRIDPWAGYQQIARFVSIMGTSERTTSTGRRVKVDRAEWAGRFLRSKLSPQAAFLWDMASGETFLGDEMTLEDPNIQEQFYNRLIPISIQDIVDAVQLEGPGAAWVGIPAVAGVGVQTYPERAWTQVAKRQDELAKEVYGRPWENLGPSQQDVLRKRYPELAETERLARGETRFKGQIDLGVEAAAGRRVRGALPQAVQDEMQRLGISIKTMGRKIGDYYLNDERYKKLQETYATILGSAEPLVNETQFDDEVKAKLFKKAKDKAKALANDIIIAEAEGETPEHTLASARRYMGQYVEAIGQTYYYDEGPDLWLPKGLSDDDREKAVAGIHAIMRYYSPELRESLTIVKPGAYETAELTGRQKNTLLTKIRTAKGVRNQEVRGLLRWLEELFNPRPAAAAPQQARETAGVR